MQVIKFFLAAVAPMVVAAMPTTNTGASGANSLSFSGTLTWYDAEGGLGSASACGDINSASDHIVAMNSAQFDGTCHKSIRIHAKGKQLDAKITDECASCSHGDIDGTKGVFQYFDDLDVGELDVTWEFI